MNIDFMKLNYTEEDRLKDEIHYEETMIARLNAMLGFAMTPVDLETILHQIDLHQKRLQVFEDELREYNRHRYTISGKCEWAYIRSLLYAYMRVRVRDGG